MTSGNIHVLLITGDGSLANLVGKQFEPVSDSFVIITVNNVEDTPDYQGTSRPDVLLIDNRSVDENTQVDLGRIFREEIPVVLLVSEMDSQPAPDVNRSAASVCVTKNEMDLARLPGIVTGLVHEFNNMGSGIPEGLEKIRKKEIREYGHLTETILNSLTELVCYQDTEHNVRWANQTECKMIDISLEEYIGKRCHEMKQGRYHSCEGCPVERAISTGRQQQAIMPGPGGLTLLITGIPEIDDDGKVVGAIETILDITKVTEAEEALHRTEEQFRILFENSPIPKMMLNDEGIFACNKACIDLFGYGSEVEILGKFPDELSPVNQPDGSDSYVSAHKNFASALRDGLLEFEWLHVRKDGSEFSAKVSLCRFDFQGSLMLEAVVIDITERKLADYELSLMNLLIDQTDDALYVIESYSGRIMYSNKTGWSRLGYTRDELLSMTVSQLEGNYPDKDAWDVAAQRIRELKSLVITGWHVRRDGSKFPVEVGIRCIDVKDDVFHIVVVRDITDRLANEEKLTRLGYIVEQAAEIIMTADHDLNIVYVNQAFTESFGYTLDDVVGKQVHILYPTQVEKVLSKVLKAFETEGFWTGRITMSRKDGSTFEEELSIRPNMDSTGTITSYLSIGRDVSEQIMLERQLHQAQKLESIGQLAAGIAHEINTPMQYVGNNTLFLQDSFKDIVDLFDRETKIIETARNGALDSEVLIELEKALKDTDVSYLAEEIPKALEQSMEGIDRVTEIVRAMKEFSHMGDDEMKAVDLNKAIESTVTVARNEWKYVAELELDLDGDLPSVPCFPGQINQVVLNLITNAAHAIGEKLGPEHSGDLGKITVSTGVEGEMMYFKVSDTGTGIPEDLRHKVFDPFFTTKEVGKGTGQGLSIAYSVITEKHGGDITLDSVMGEGTSFIVKLPLVQKELSEVPEPVECD